MHKNSAKVNSSRPRKYFKTDLYVPALSYRVGKQFLNNFSAAGINELRRKEVCENFTTRVNCQNRYLKLKKLWLYTKVGPYQSPFTAELSNTKYGIFLSFLANYAGQGHVISIDFSGSLSVFDRQQYKGSCYFVTTMRSDNFTNHNAPFLCEQALFRKQWNPQALV